MSPAASDRGLSADSVGGGRLAGVTISDGDDERGVRATSGRRPLMTAPTAPVLVGVDGSEESLAAAVWAAAEADLLHASLHIVVANDDPVRDDYATAVARQAAHQCRAQAPSLAVTYEVVRDHPAEVLLARSHRARLIVVGTRGHGRVMAALLGSISTAVAYHAVCPVIVVPGNRLTAATAPVVVGLDGSIASQAALQFAFDVAAARHTELTAVHTWREPVAEYPMMVADAIAGPPSESERIERVVEQSLAQQLSGWDKKYPDVPVRLVAREGHPVDVLCGLAEEAHLLVVGHRGRGGFAGLMLGSVAAGVLHHARQPVAVIRAPHQSDCPGSPGTGAASSHATRAGGLSTTGTSGASRPSARTS
jgi:nucleotide-binding universal stress UspA family protein